MLSDRMRSRSRNRLSSLFSLGSNSDAGSVMSNSSSRLSKVRNRIASAPHLAPDYPPSPPPYHESPLQSAVQPVESAPAPLEPPPSIAPRSRNASPVRRSSGSVPDSRPGTATPDSGLQIPDSKLKKLRRKSGLFLGGPTEEKVGQPSQGGPRAWVIGHRGKVPYDLAMLLDGEKVPELWDEQGDTLVYLFPRTSGKGPSFRIDSSLYAASGYMTRLVHGRLYSDAIVDPQNESNRSSRTPSSGNYGSSRTTSPDRSFPEGSSDGSKGSRALSDATEDDHSETHLYLPIQLSTDSAPVTPGMNESPLTAKDTDTLVTYRNFVAFLMGQSLVATSRQSEVFDIFVRISDILQQYQFSNLDGSTFGEVAASSFDAYVDELNLADVRTSREKSIDAIILGERMRSAKLYTEGFVHAVGTFDSLKESENPKLGLISSKTMTRMARAALDLEMRVKNINNKLTDFDFAAMFSGLMNSDTSEEKKIVRFKNWKIAFLACRSFFMDYYKAKYGSWLPKARSKKNNLTTSGLNRLVLRDLYQDLSTLYDSLVDRTNLTSRTADGFMSEDQGDDFETTVVRALRKVLSEYDRSTPPVQPPIPFDVPLYPTLKGVNGKYASGDAKKDAKERAKKVKSDDLAKMLKNSHNADVQGQSNFLDAFRLFEQKQAHGRTMEELWEMRSGHWMFLYAVIQSLPMTVMDAPNIQFSEGVEYFLCVPPRSGMPWGREDTSRARTWFGVAGGSHVVSLPTDVVEHGVEGVFRRSHCWQMAQKWSQNDVLLNAAVQETMNAAPLPPPPGLHPSSAVRSRSSSPDWTSRRESVMNLGLEALPLPTGGPTSPLAMRPASSHDPSKTFDMILQNVDLPNQNPKSKKKK